MPLLVVIAFLVGLFWLVPTDPVPTSVGYSCLKSARILAEHRETSRAYRTNTSFDRSFAGPYVASDTPLPDMWGSVVKSGLRRTIEGRLKWLGLPSDLAFLNPKVCPDPE